MSSGVDKYTGAMLINPATCWALGPRYADPRDLAGLPLVSLAASIRQPSRIPMNIPADGSWSLRGAPLLRIAPFLKPGLPARSSDSEGGGRSSGSVSSDCCSVTSDEGVAPAPVESLLLPRIIKPRKRRKKERRLAFAQKNRETVTRVDADPNPDIDILGIVQLNVNPDTEPRFFPRLPLPEKIPDERIRQLDSMWNGSLYPDLDDELPEIDRLNLSDSDSAFPVSFIQSQRKLPEEGVQESNTCWNGYSYLDSDEFSPEGSARSLEIHSEIISSPYGHRDIEIRFFSSLRK